MPLLYTTSFRISKAYASFLLIQVYYRVNDTHATILHVGQLETVP
jgi:hypothetical protein